MRTSSIDTARHVSHRQDEEIDEGRSKDDVGRMGSYVHIEFILSDTFREIYFERYIYQRV